MSLRSAHRASLIILCVGIGLLGLPLPGASAPLRPPPALPDTGDAASPKALSALAKGTTEAQLQDYEEAIVFFERALDHAPQSPAVLQALADAHAALGDDATALFYARRAHDRAPDQRYYLRRLAELQRDAGQPQAAADTYQALLERFPDAHATYRALARLQADLDRPEAALETYRRLLSQTTRPSIDVYRHMASLYRDLGDTEGVENMLRTLVERRPNSRRYRRRLGEHYADTDRPSLALDLLGPLAAQQPDDEALGERVRRLSAQTGRTAPAPSTGTTADPSALSSLSVDQLVQRAQSAVEAAVSASPPDSADLRTAEALLDRALDRAPQHVAGRRARARLYEARGQHERAGRLLEQLAEDDPRTVAHWARAAKAYLDATAYERAATVAEEGLLLFPGHAPLARTAGLARLQSGAPKRARDHFRRALDLGSPTAALLEHLGDAEHALGNEAAARTYWQRALDRAPDRSSLRKKLEEGPTS